MNQEIRAELREEVERWGTKEQLRRFDVETFRMMRGTGYHSLDCASGRGLPCSCPKARPKERLDLLKISAAIGLAFLIVGMIELLTAPLWGWWVFRH